MANKIIAATLEVTDNASAPIKDVNKAAQDANKTLKETQVTAKDTNSAIQDIGGSFGNLKNQLATIHPALKDASAGVDTLSSAFKAMLANPVVLVITAIVAALAFLYKAFTNTKEGADTMEQQFAGIKAAASVLLDAIFNLGGAIIKFFSGDFKGAFEQAKAAVTGVVDAVENAYSKTVEFTRQLQKIREEQLKADVDASKRAVELSDIRDKALDPDVPVAERKSLLKQLKDADDKAADEDIDRAKRKRDALIGLKSLDAVQEKKNLADIAQATIDYNQVVKASNDEKRKADRLIRQANKEEAAQDKAERDAAIAEAKKKREELEAFNTQLTKLHRETVLAGITDQYKKEQILLENKIADEQNLIKKEFQDGKITRDQFNQLNLAQAETNAVQRKALLDKHNNEIIQAEEDLQDKIFKLNEEATEKEIKRQAAEDKRELADAKKHTGTVLGDPKKAFEAKEAAVDAEQALVQKAFDNKVLTESEYNDKIEQLAQDRQKIRQQELKEQNQAADAASGLLDGIADAIGRNTAAGKALAIAAATIKALQAEITIIANLSEVGPFGFVAGIAAAAAVGVGLFNTIKQIESVQVPGQGSVSSSPSSPLSIPAPAAPLSPRQASTQLPQDQINQIGAANNVRAYVVESDSADAANRAARLASASKLGGH